MQHDTSLRLIGSKIHIVPPVVPRYQTKIQPVLDHNPLTSHVHLLGPERKKIEEKGEMAIFVIARFDR